MFISVLLVIMNYVNEIITALCYIKKLDGEQEDYCIKWRNVGTAL